jgi:hypothetical protein
MTDKEAMKLALEALENWLEFDPENFGEVDNKAITALQEALAEQPAQQEPVAYIRLSKTGHVMACAKTGDFYKLPDKTLLYTSPPAQRPWVGLTHEEHMEIMTGTMTTSSRMAAVEAKLKEKNT